MVHLDVGFQHDAAEAVTCDVDWAAKILTLAKFRSKLQDSIKTSSPAAWDMQSSRAPAISRGLGKLPSQDLVMPTHTLALWQRIH